VGCMVGFTQKDRIGMKLETYTKMDKNGKEVEKQRYPKLYGKRRKEMQREEATERAKEWGKLTIEQKWSELDKRSGECKKQKEKLLKGIKSGEVTCSKKKRKSR
jgi:hypothetical protein